jgi:acyl-CoA hydrolase
MIGKKTGVIYNDVKKSVDEVLDYVGNDIIFAMTLALGKPILFINELYRRAKEDPTIKLKIVTALALERPRMRTDIERRLLAPLVDRIFEGTPEFDYVKDFRAGKLPKNVEMYEFFSKAGGYIHDRDPQCHHLCSNYTHVVRDAMNFGTNVFGELVSGKIINGKMMYSMACNPDICIGALQELQKKRERGIRVASIAEVNTQMPFMYGDAIKEAKDYDILLQGPQFNYPLFGPPKDAVNIKDHMIGIHVSSLIKDGGTLQVGIGALGDAIAAGLSMRQNNNEAYNRVLEKTGIKERYKDLINEIGGTGTFKQGLYGSSEMFVDAFMQLYKSGVLKRKVYDSIPIMKLVNSGKLLPDRIPANILELLIKDKGINPKLTEEDFKMLTEFGILQPGLKYKDGYIISGKTKISADLSVAKNLTAVKKLLGKELKNGQVIQGAFFIGPRSFYNELNAMSEDERKQFIMNGVEKVNHLYGGEELRVLQRKDGRFVNATMLVNALGATASDQLEDGRVISGIGGQYNFVAMAHEIPDARLIMMARSTRNSGGKIKSNIVYNYGHTSIPKHLRDIIVTEYGIADVRGVEDWKIIDRILKITDSRFQDDIIKQAKKNLKLPKDYVLPAEYRNNTPKKLEEMLKPFQAEGYFPAFPFGTDLFEEEIILGGSLKALAKTSKPLIVRGILFELFRFVPEKAEPLLKRMQLDKPSNLREKILQKVVLAALRLNKKI